MMQVNFKLLGKFSSVACNIKKISLCVKGSVYFLKLRTNCIISHLLVINV